MTHLQVLMDDAGRKRKLMMDDADGNSEFIMDDAGGKLESMIEPGKFMMLGAPKLARWQKVFYGAGDSTNSMSGTIIDLFLLYYFTDNLGLSPILAGMVLLFGQVWDAVNDPIVGYLSDRTRSRFGRRRIFMAASAVPLGLSYVLMWRLPAGMPQWSTFLLAVLVYVLYDTCMTAFFVPYQAMGIEITKNYDERTSLVAWRMLFSIVLGLVATVVPMMIVDAVPAVFPTEINQAVDEAVQSGALPDSFRETMHGGITAANGAVTPDLLRKIKVAVTSENLPADFVDAGIGLPFRAAAEEIPDWPQGT